MDPSHHDTGDLKQPTGQLPLGQRLFDNMYLLLIVGVLIMLAVFTSWGMWEIISMPKDTLP